MAYTGGYLAFHSMYYLCVFYDESMYKYCTSFDIEIEDLLMFFFSWHWTMPCLNKRHSNKGAWHDKKEKAVQS